LGIDDFAFGHFRQRRVFRSGAVVDTTGLGRCVIEPELCFTLASALPTGATAEQVRHSLRGVAAAFEVLDYPRQDEDISVLDALASGIGAWALVVGSEVPATCAFERST